MALVLLSLVCVYGMKFTPLKGFNTNYLSRETTTAIKGIFVFLVFMSHFSQYYPEMASHGHLYYYVKNYSGQLIVTMFLFYSGYGIYESIKRKGVDYVKSFPKNRVLKTLFHLDCAILIYFIINLIFGLKYSFGDYLLSLIGWKSVGNSNWFMFTIIVLYIIVFASFSIFKKNKLLSLIATTAVSVLFVFLLSKVKEKYWYNTVICFLLGLWYSYFKDFIEKKLVKNNIIYCFLLALAAASYIISFKYVKSFWAYEIWMSSFVAIVLLVSMKLNICNKALLWLGNHVFSVYILQRIPMLIFRELDIKLPDLNLTFFICFIITIVISALFDKTTGLIDKKLFKK